MMRSSRTEGIRALQPGSAIALSPGTIIAGKYRIESPLARGGMGSVWAGRHTTLGHLVAIKFIHPRLATSREVLRRFDVEAKAAARLKTRHAVAVYDHGVTPDGEPYIVMEYLEGESLAECLTREHELTEQRTLRIASQAASALAAAHAKGIVHRDIKPENLFLLKRNNADFVKVVDFGISKSLRASSEEEAAQRLTQTGMVLGTPLYMSPEQARGDEDLDHRVDIYALGVIMYEAIAGRVPFAGTNYLSVISQVLNEDPKPVREIRPDVSEELEAIIAKAMAKDPHLA